MSSAKNSALKYLSFRSRSIKEVRDYLIRKKFAPEEIATAIDDLIELNFLNDEKFAEEWVEIHIRAKPCGPIKLKFELQQKGIASEIIQKTLKLDYQNLVQKAAQRYSRRLIGLDPQKQKQRLAGFLARHGFSWDQIKPVLDKYWYN